MANNRVKQPVTKGVVKVPVVMQMEALECGAASLTMILAYYGKWIPLEQIREDCGVSRDGSNAKNMIDPSPTDSPARIPAAPRPERRRLTM